MANQYPDRTLAERLWERIDQSGGPDACWPWTGARFWFGHGAVKVAGRPWGAHRIAWEVTNGPIPDGLNVLHRCDNPPCCNPAHLFLGSQLDNVRDMDAKGRRARKAVAALNEPSMATTPLSAEEERHVREQDAAFRPGDAVYARPGWLDGLLMERRALLATLDAERAKGIDVGLHEALRQAAKVVLANPNDLDALVALERAVYWTGYSRTAALAEPAEPVTPGFVGLGGEAE